MILAATDFFEDQLLDELTEEANIVFSVTLLAIAKELSRSTGESSGVFPCPRCHTGKVEWGILRDGRASVLCSTTHEDDGETYRCTSAME